MLGLADRVFELRHAQCCSTGRWNRCSFVVVWRASEKPSSESVEYLIEPYDLAMFQLPLLVDMSVNRLNTGLERTRSNERGIGRVSLQAKDRVEIHDFPSSDAFITQPNIQKWSTGRCLLRVC